MKGLVAAAACALEAAGFAAWSVAAPAGTSARAANSIYDRWLTNCFNETKLVRVESMAYPTGPDPETICP